MVEFVMKGCSVNVDGHLTLDGVDTVEMAKKYGTPLYLLSEDSVRYNCRTYVNAVRKNFGDGSYPCFASKALSFKGIYSIVGDEGMGSDAVSAGELYTANAAGFDMSRVFFHGNNKTDADIRYAIELGTGWFVVDNVNELDSLDKIAGEMGVKQKILLRITPGIDPHTHQAIATGKVDSKFGSAIATGQAEEIVRLALGKNNIELHGYHCHIGSQIFEVEPFIQAAEIMIGFIADIKASVGFEADVLNLGGGFGVRYVKEHPYFDYAGAITTLANAVKSACAEKKVVLPKIILEPGRAIVADACLTLYTVGSVKQIPDIKNYVSVDGGMPDNPRYALYQSQYEFVIANKANNKPVYACSIAGRCCESGDLIGENVMLQTPEKGDILAVEVTGAYNYSMASNYNRLPRPAMVVLRNGEDRIAVRRESFEDLIKNDN